MPPRILTVTSILVGIAPIGIGCGLVSHLSQGATDVIESD